MSKTWNIQVPGSTANLGPGFDSIGIALGLYLTLDVTLSDQWAFDHQSVHLPQEINTEDHLIYQSANYAASCYGAILPSCKVIVQSELPLARGIGSSAAAIAAGVELANQLCELNLTLEEKCRIATDLEGHPDNATASLCGGLTIGAMLPDGGLSLLSVKEIDIAFALFIPNVELKTQEARDALPSTFDRGYAVQASAYANVLTAALLMNDWKRVGEMMEADLFHEPFRANIIPYYNKIRELAKENGAYGTAISGAGPTMISLVQPEEVDEFVEKMRPHLPDYEIKAVSIDRNGIQLKVSEYI